MTHVDLDIGRMAKAYRVHIKWLEPTGISDPIRYTARGARGPLIWIDPKTETLYFLMTD